MEGSTFPMDILAGEILSKLPVKTLVRFKCVSRFFKTLISSPEFVRCHLRHSLSSADNLRVVLLRRGDGLYSFRLDSPELPVITLPFLQSVAGIHGLPAYSRAFVSRGRLVRVPGGGVCFQDGVCA